MGAHPEELLALMPFAAGTGVELDRADPAEVAGRLAWAPERCTAGGLMHGGALMTLADSVGAVCAFLNLPPGASTATVSSTTSLVRAVRSGIVHAVARPAHVGHSFVLVQVELTDDEGRLVAQVTQTQAVLRASDRGRPAP
jgi:1,4-dihydroxy-2-naphthoyl-CoA hydrolase